MSARHGASWRLDRRGLLRLVLTGLGTTLPGIGHGGESEVAEPWRLPNTRVDLRELLESYFGSTDLSVAAAVGRGHAMMFPDGNAALRLRVDSTIEAIARIVDVTDALAILDQTVREDFDQLRLEYLHGWQLARTELDLCMAAWWLHQVEFVTTAD